MAAKEENVPSAPSLVVTEGRQGNWFIGVHHHFCAWSRCVPTSLLCSFISTTLTQCKMVLLLYGSVDKQCQRTCYQHLFFMPLKSKNPLLDDSATSSNTPYFVQLAQPFLKCMGLGMFVFWPWRFLNSRGLLRCLCFLSYLHIHSQILCISGFSPDIK